MLNSNRFITSFRIISLSILLLYLPNLAQANDTTPAMDFWCDYFQTLGEDCIALPPIPEEPQELAEWEAFLDAFVVAAFKSTREPTITIPQKLPQNSTASISVKAMNTHFNNDSDVKMEKNDNNSLIQINSITFESPEELIINVTVPAEIDAPSQYDIVVKTPLNNGTIEKITGENMLHITEASSIPKIISIMPSHVKQGANSVSITFYAVGVDFDESSEIHFGNIDENSGAYSGDSYFTVEEIIIHNETSLTAVLSIDEFTPKKLYNTTIKTNTHIAEGVLYSGFLQVYQAALPEIIAIEPSHGRQTETIDVVLTGENVNFSDESEIQFDGTGIEVLPTSVTAVNSTLISATIKIADDAELTSRTISVITGVEETEPFYYAFTVEKKIPRTVQIPKENQEVNDFFGKETDDDIEDDIEPVGTNSDDVDVVTSTDGDSTEPIEPTDVDDKPNDPPVNPQPAETNPNEPPLSPSHPDQIQFSPDNSDRVDENGIVDNEPFPSPSSSSSQICPAKGQVNTSCRAEGVIITDLKVGENGHIDGGTLKGTLENDGWVTNFIVESGSRFENNGWVSNLTIQPEAILIGSILTSYIINEGTLIDIDFRGAYVIGGYLGGTIFNNSKVNGYFKDVSLMPNTHIIGGALRGKIEGDPQYPALLESLRVRRNSHLSHVIIGSNVELADDVTLGAGVVKMEKAVALHPAGEVDTQALMIGGSFINDGDFKQQNELSRSDLITIHGSIRVDPAHVGQPADILICGAYRPLTSPKRKPLFYMIDTEDEIHLWDEEIVNLVTFREIESLGEIENVEMYMGYFESIGILNIYFGYRLEDGTIVYNLKTIDVSIME